MPLLVHFVIHFILQDLVRKVRLESADHRYCIVYVRTIEVRTVLSMCGLMEVFELPLKLMLLVRFKLVRWQLFDELLFEKALYRKSRAPFHLA